MGRTTFYISHYLLLRGLDSNQRHTSFQPVALPTVATPQFKRKIGCCLKILRERFQDLKLHHILNPHTMNVILIFRFVAALIRKNPISPPSVVLTTTTPNGFDFHATKLVLHLPHCSRPPHMDLLSPWFSLSHMSHLTLLFQPQHELVKLLTFSWDKGSRTPMHI